MQDYIKKILNYLEKKSIKVYLFLTNAFIVLFAIFLSNAGLLPFKNVSDLLILTLLGLSFALYRPGWAFLFFIGSIALENVNLAPESIGLSLRPYQFFGILVIISLSARHLGNRINFSLIKINFLDKIILALLAASFASTLFSVNFAGSIKQTLILSTFIAFYFLVRIYVKSIADIKRIFPFFMTSSFIILIYSIWQNVRFSLNMEHFEVMAGRPNATFPEPDWLGIFTVFLLAVVYSVIYYFDTAKARHETNGDSIFNLAFVFKKYPFLERIGLCKSPSILINLFLILNFVVLLITVSRSAWLGAALVSTLFVLLLLFNGGFKPKDLSWKRASSRAVIISSNFLIALLLTIVLNLTTFQLLGRAQSTASGLQEITVACGVINPGLPEIIKDVESLKNYGCRHINLEEIENEENTGRFVTTVYRPDPNFSVRSDIYKKSWDEIKKDPIFGIGWGNIGKILGEDERGSSFNSSNIFLETWLGAGIAGFISLVLLLLTIIFYAVKSFFSEKNKDKLVAIFILLGLTAIIIPNFFNSGLFLGFFWLYLGITASLLDNELDKK